MGIFDCLRRKTKRNFDIDNETIDTSDMRNHAPYYEQIEPGDLPLFHLSNKLISTTIAELAAIEISYILAKSELSDEDLKTVKVLQGLLCDVQDEIDQKVYKAIQVMMNNNPDVDTTDPKCTGQDNIGDPDII